MLISRMNEKEKQILAIEMSPYFSWSLFIARIQEPEMREGFVPRNMERAISKSGVKPEDESQKVDNSVRGQVRSSFTSFNARYLCFLGHDMSSSSSWDLYSENFSSSFKNFEPTWLFKRRPISRIIRNPYLLVRCTVHG